MTPLQIAHPAAVCIDRAQKCVDLFEKSEAVFLAVEILVRFDALALANCALRDGMPLSDLARGRLLAPRFHLGDWVGLLESLAKATEREPFKSFRSWLRAGARSRVQHLLCLRNRKVHPERLIDTSWVAALVEEAQRLMNQIIAIHPALSDLVAMDDGRLMLGGIDTDVSGVLLHLDRVASPPRIGLYKGASAGRLFWSFLDGSEQESRIHFEAFVRAVGARVPTLETLDARAETSALTVRFEAAARATIRYVTDLRRYRPEQTIDRDEPEVYLEAFLRGDVPMLVVEGPEGAGKSTWLCRIAEDRLAAGLPVLFETASRLGGAPPQALANSLLITGDLSDGLDRLALASPDGRVVVLIDDVASTGGTDPVFVGCLRWAEAASRGSAVRLIVAARSEHIQAYRTGGGTVPASHLQTFLLPPLVEPELTRLAERLPIPAEVDRSAILARRRELARNLARSAASTLRRPAFATAIIESGGAARTSDSFSAHSLYSRLIDTDIFGKDESGRPLWPRRWSIAAGVAHALLLHKKPFVGLDAIEATGVRLLDPQNGQRFADYAALLDGGHLAERFDEPEASIGFSNPKLFECIAARLHKAGNIPEQVAHFAEEAASFRSALGVAAFLIAESWASINVAELVCAVEGIEPAMRNELLLQVGAVAPEPFLGLVEEFGKTDPASCLDVVATQIHIGEAGLAAAAAALLRREPPFSPEALRARYLHARALYEHDDFLAVEREVNAMGDPVDPAVRILAAEAAASRADWDRSEACWRSIIEGLSPDESIARGTALRGLGYVLAHRGSPAEAELLLKQALPFLESAGCERARSEALGELAEVFSASGRFGEARECLERSFRITEQTGHLAGLGVIEGQFGRVAADEKAWSEAEARLRKAMDIHERVGNRWRRAWTYDQLARVEEATGRLNEAATSRAVAARLYVELGVGAVDGSSGVLAKDLQCIMAELRG